MFRQIKSSKCYEEKSIFRETKKSQWSGLRKWEATTQAGVDTVCCSSGLHSCPKLCTDLPAMSDRWQGNEHFCINACLISCDVYFFLFHPPKQYVILHMASIIRKDFFLTTFLHNILYDSPYNFSPHLANTTLHLWKTLQRQSLKVCEMEVARPPLRSTTLLGKGGLNEWLVPSSRGQDCRHRPCCERQTSLLRPTTPLKRLQTLL